MSKSARKTPEIAKKVRLHVHRIIGDVSDKGTEHEDGAHRQVPRRRADGQDLDFNWLVRDYGAQWEEWRLNFSAYIHSVDSGMDQRKDALRMFATRYLIPLGLPSDPAWLLSRRTSVPDVFPAIWGKRSKNRIKANNYLSEFIDWLLVSSYSLSDDYGRPVVSPEFHNPVPRLSASRGSVPSESVRSALPYAYIDRLRQILAPGANFCDWVWAQNAIGMDLDEEGRATRKGSSTGDWFEVDPSLIDQSDPDCVWRTRIIGHRLDSITRKVIARNLTITELWSPVRSVALLTKLHLPLRSSQVRWLDSGEADTWRYETLHRKEPERAQHNPRGFRPHDWSINLGALAEGDERNPIARGVFRRIEDPEIRSISTGFYINTNKTADADSVGDEKGYVIPWQKDDLLYWLEKLRNWQVKYNPIRSPMSWSRLEKRHLGELKSKASLARYSDTCFLFRDAAADGDNKAKPLHTISMERLWFQLLRNLQEEEAAKGVAYEDGRPLQFVKAPPHDNQESTTHFPLHSLRVSLLTCLALDGEVPLPVLSKLVAGHSRLIMTIYYQKVTPYRVSELLAEAQKRMRESSPESVRRFLAEESFKTLADRLVVLDTASFRSGLGEQPGDRVPAGWMPVSVGWCLAGGNASPAEANARLPGCYNGGVRAKGLKKVAHGPVHGGARNCVACRWLVTGPQYLEALCARANEVSLQLSDASMELTDLDEQIAALRREAYRAERHGQPWSGAEQLSSLAVRYERCASVVDGHGTTLAYAWRLIVRCLRIGAEKNDRAMISGGIANDVKLALREVDSRMLQIHRVCMDAEIHPEVQPGEALFVRSQWIDAALQRDGHRPIMFTLTKGQQLSIGNRLLDDLGEQRNPDNPELGRDEVLLALEHGESLAELGLYTATLDSLDALAVAPAIRVGQQLSKLNPKLGSDA